jgi:hypothetical protein
MQRLGGVGRVFEEARLLLQRGRLPLLLLLLENYLVFEVLGEAS